MPDLFLPGSISGQFVSFSVPSMPGVAVTIVYCIYGGTVNVVAGDPSKKVTMAENITLPYDTILTCDGTTWLAQGFQLFLPSFTPTFSGYSQGIGGISGNASFPPNAGQDFEYWLTHGGFNPTFKNINDNGWDWTISSMSLRITYQSGDTCFGTTGSNADNTIVSDVFGNIMVSAWFGDISGSTKPLYIAIDRGPQKNMGSGSGSTAGFSTYRFSTTIDSRSNLGLWFTATGRLVMRYDTYSAGGTKTTKYVTNDKFGGDAAVDWSAPTTASPGEAKQLGVGRAQAQGMTLRIGN